MNTNRSWLWLGFLIGLLVATIVMLLVSRAREDQLRALYDDKLAECSAAQHDAFGAVNQSNRDTGAWQMLAQMCEQREVAASSTSDAILDRLKTPMPSPEPNIDARVGYALDFCIRGQGGFATAECVWQTLNTVIDR